MKFLIIAVKELRVFIRDRHALFFTFAMPLLFITAFGLAFGSAGERISLAVVQGENSEFADNYVSALSSALENFGIKNVGMTTAEDYLRAGEVVAIIIVPQGFNENNNDVYFIYDEGKETSATTVKTALEETNLSFFGKQTTVTTQSTRTEAPSSAFQYMIPGFGIYFILMIGGIFGGETVLRERETGTFRRSLLAPISRATFLGGKLFFGFIIGCLQLLIFFGVGILVFGMSIAGSLWLVALIGMLVVLFGVGLGLLVSTFVRSSNACLGTVMAIVMPMAVLGGLFFPIEMMPGYIQSFAQVFPVYHGQQAFLDVIIRGKDLGAIAPSVLIFAGFVIAIFLLGIWLFKWEEK